VGGGIAGLAAARVFADHFESVTVVEKDKSVGSPQVRTGAAQGAHLHVLLQHGQEILLSLFPELEEKLANCPKVDWAADTKWETAEGAFPPLFFNGTDALHESPIFRMLHLRVGGKNSQCVFPFGTSSRNRIYW
jgi:uncharacterized protein with NAD-binding domain and iron-sulfur cluster